MSGLQSPTFQFISFAGTATPPTPPGGVIYVYFDNASSTLKQINDQGVTSSFGGGLSAIPNGYILANISGGSATPVGVQEEDIVTVTGSAVQSVSLAGAFGGISGDVDGRYQIECYIVLPSGTGSVSYVFKPNNLLTNSFCTVLISNGSTVTTGNVNAAGFYITTSGTTNAGVLFATINFEAKTGQPRHYSSRSFRYDPTAAAYQSYYTEGYWTDTSTVLTDMQIAASAASDIGVGSTFKVRRAIGGK